MNPIIKDKDFYHHPLYHTLLTDPDVRAKVLELLTQNGLVPSVENVSPNIPSSSQCPSPIKQVKTKMRFESPSALHRRRALEKMKSTSSSSEELPQEKKEEMLPLARGPPVPFEQLLKGVVAYCEVRSNNADRSAGTKAMMSAMGATVLDTLSRNVTHVVFKDGMFSTYQKAKLLKKHFVSVLWVDAIRRHKFRVPESKYPALGAKSNVHEADMSKICETMQREYDDVVTDERRRRSEIKQQRTPHMNVTQRRKTTVHVSQNITTMNDDADLSSLPESSSSSCISEDSVSTRSNIAKYVKDSFELKKSLLIRSPESLLNRSIEKNLTRNFDDATDENRNALKDENPMHLRISSTDESANSTANKSKLSGDAQNIATKLNSITKFNNSDKKIVETDTESMRLRISTTDESNLNSTGNKLLNSNDIINITNDEDCTNSSKITKIKDRQKNALISSDINVTNDEGCGNSSKITKIKNKLKNALVSSEIQEISNDSTSSFLLASQEVEDVVKESEALKMQVNESDLTGAGSKSAIISYNEECTNTEKNNPKGKQTISPKNSNEPLEYVKTLVSVNTGKTKRVLSSSTTEKESRGELLKSFDDNDSSSSKQKRKSKVKKSDKSLLIPKNKVSLVNLSNIAQCSVQNSKLLTDDETSDKLSADQNRIVSNRTSAKNRKSSTCSKIKNNKITVNEVEKSKEKERCMTTVQKTRRLYRVDQTLDEALFDWDKLKIDDNKAQANDEDISSNKKTKYRIQVPQSLKEPILSNKARKLRESVRKNNKLTGTSTATSETNISPKKTRRTLTFSSSDSDDKNAENNEKAYNPSTEIVTPSTRRSTRINTPKLVKQIPENNKKDIPDKAKGTGKNKKVSEESSDYSPSKRLKPVEEDKSSDSDKAFKSSTQTATPRTRKSNKISMPKQIKGVPDNNKKDTPAKNTVKSKKVNDISSDQSPSKRSKPPEEEVITPRRSTRNTINRVESPSTNSIKTPAKTPSLRKKILANKTPKLTSDDKDDEVTQSSDRRSTLEFVERPSRKSLARIKLTQNEKSKQTAKLSSIVCTRLHKQEVYVFQQIVRKLGGFIAEDEVSSRTSHVVAGDPARTINMLRAIARGCWIVRLEWLYKSLEADKWIDEEEYEMVEFSPAVQKCRIEKRSFGPLFCMDLFKNCGDIFVARSSIPRFSDLEELVTLCGGNVVKTPRQAQIVVGEKFRCQDIKCVNVEWILDSIMQNKRMSFRQYIISGGSNEN